MALKDYIYPKQVMVSTATENGFQVAGTTWNFDYIPDPAYKLRFEYRNFFSKDSVFIFSDAARPQEHIVSVAGSLKI